MRPIVLVWLLLASASLFAGTTREGEGEHLLRQRSEALSARLLIREWQDSFARNSFPEGEAEMQDGMRKDPGANRSVSSARKNARRQFEATLRSAYRREAGKRIAPFTASLGDAEKEALLRGRPEFFRDRTEALFEPSFLRARAAVTEEQKSRIFRQVYPAAEELESLDDAGLAAALEDRFRKGMKEPLYEENLAFLRKDLIRPAIAEGRAQQALQLHLVQEAVIPGDVWDAAPAREFLTDFVKAELIRQVPDAARRYPLFSKTRTQIAVRAEKLPFDRVSARFSAEFPGEKYDRMLRAHPEAHRSLRQSADAVASAWAKDWVRDAIRLAAPPEAWRSRLQEAPVVLRAAEARLRGFSDKMIPLRNAFAAEQLKQHWPELAAGEWVPDPSVVESYASGDRKALPAAQARLNAPGLLAECFAQEEVLLRAALDREVKRLEDQRAAVGAVYDAVLAQMENRQQEKLQKDDSWIRRLFRFGTSANVRLEEIVGHYRTEVENRSSKPLFPSTEEEILVRSRAILAQILTPEPKPETPKNDPEPKPDALKVELILSGAEGAFALRMDGWDHSFARIGDASRAAAAELQKRAGSAEPKEREVTIQLTVAGDRIYYHTVAELREALLKALPGCSVEDSLPKAR